MFLQEVIDWYILMWANKVPELSWIEVINKMTRHGNQIRAFSCKIWNSVKLIIAVIV
jgi:hypothetical protein